MPLLKKTTLLTSQQNHARGPFVPHQNHLLLELAICVVLRADLVVEIKQLLQGFAFRRHDKADYMHQQLGHGISVEHDRDNVPHGLHLGLVIALFQLHSQVLQGRLIRSVVQMDQAVRIVEERRHGGMVAGEAAVKEDKEGGELSDVSRQQRGI